jgi:hypothetical protein
LLSSGDSLDGAPSIAYDRVTKRQKWSPERHIQCADQAARDASTEVQAGGFTFKENKMTYLEEHEKKTPIEKADTILARRRAGESRKEIGDSIGLGESAVYKQEKFAEFREQHPNADVKTATDFYKYWK